MSSAPPSRGFLLEVSDDAEVNGGYGMGAGENIHFDSTSTNTRPTQTTSACDPGDEAARGAANEVRVRGRGKLTNYRGFGAIRSIYGTPPDQNPASAATASQWTHVEQSGSVRQQGTPPSGRSSSQGAGAPVPQRGLLTVFRARVEYYMQPFTEASLLKQLTGAAPKAATLESLTATYTEDYAHPIGASTGYLPKNPSLAPTRWQAAEAEFCASEETRAYERAFEHDDKLHAGAPNRSLARAPQSMHAYQHHDGVARASSLLSWVVKLLALAIFGILMYWLGGKSNAGGPVQGI